MEDAGDWVDLGAEAHVEPTLPSQLPQSQPVVMELTALLSALQRNFIWTPEERARADAACLEAGGIVRGIIAEGVPQIPALRHVCASNGS